MSPVTLFFFRILLVLGGIILILIIGKPMVESIQQKFTGNSVEGRIIGFRGKRTSTSVFTENTGRKNGKIRSRRPVYRYPVTENSLDSLDGFAKSTVLIPWFNFTLNEKVTVVFETGKPQNSHLFSPGILLTDFLLILLSLFMIKLGITRTK